MILWLGVDLKEKLKKINQRKHKGNKELKDKLNNRKSPNKVKKLLDKNNKVRKKGNKDKLNHKKL